MMYYFFSIPNYLTSHNVETRVKKFLLFKILGMSNNLEWREHFTTVSNCNRFFKCDAAASPFFLLLLGPKRQ